jgi:hypothetical protein
MPMFDRSTNDSNIILREFAQRVHAKNRQLVTNIELKLIDN